MFVTVEEVLMKYNHRIIINTIKTTENRENLYIWIDILVFSENRIK